MKQYEVLLIENGKQITITVAGRSKRTVKDMIENKNRKVISIKCYI